MRYLKVREVSIKRIEEILASLNTNVRVQILPNHNSTYFYVGVSIYKVKILGIYSINLLNKLVLPYTYYNKFLD